MQVSVVSRDLIHQLGQREYVNGAGVRVRVHQGESPVIERAYTSA